ncbi:unnamed protein product [Caenorhabditis bovis]|uniref:Uncharacterized protein n=1 Tax=Caenorhabditis bovis TaxID=2654633 RepID=A0A8S1EK65_9PELO|nr:unnamed protein product [Caenorhabditis bovis]
MTVICITTRRTKKVLQTLKPQINQQRVFSEDGIKYTEIVRSTPLGGVQVAHVPGDNTPSLLGTSDLFKGLRGHQNDYEANDDVYRRPWDEHPPAGLLNSVGNLVDNVFVFLFGPPEPEYMSRKAKL